MAITSAFCVELDKEVDIYEAREEYFAQAEPREPFTFLCPDKNCRDTYSPHITGVNYRKMPGVDPIKNRPHFRANSDSPHSQDCPWVEYREAVEELEQENDGQPRNFKEHDLVDIFKPQKEVANKDESKTDDYLEWSTHIKTITNKRSRINAWKEALKNSPHKTTKLEEVVSCFLSMSEDDLHNYHLTIPGVGKRTYRQHFKPIRYSKPDGIKRIFYGFASISLWENKRYYFNFKTKTKDSNFPNAKVSAFITVEQLEQFRGGKFLQTQLELCMEQEKSVCCFVFGEAEEILNREKELNLSFDSLHSFALRTKNELPERD
ncbi:conserved hypothetical protein [Candidatus Terasakiella magnetica]|uniref:Uncharacterized protein n=1 Tax=Candidatus Terasakiella magnetica TaxID=1867952 RepID=A0A1C3RHQ8_9PROT|nr:hypothetical protein [Candidatus Terasakiella magnetica]SCA56742.1 conserved hypothetical protein [Candidatus Terasakiella magnetica]